MFRQACKINGVSRQHFYDIRKAYEEHGLEGLAEKTRKKPCMKNRVSPEIEEAVHRMAIEFPSYGQMRASNELRKAGILVSGGGVRSIGSATTWRLSKSALPPLKRRRQPRAS